jgi:hypothetical protein
MTHLYKRIRVLLPVYRLCHIQVGGSTRLVKRVVFGLGLNVSGRNRVGHEPDMRTRFANPSINPSSPSCLRLIPH